MILTNRDQGDPIDDQLHKAGRADWTEPEPIIALRRGRDELVHRALKAFRTEELPFRRFRRFQADAAVYYTVLVVFFLFEALQRDVAEPVVAATAYVTRVRRVTIDFAAKIVRTGGETILKVTAAIWHGLTIQDLWERGGKPPTPRLGVAPPARERRRTAHFTPGAAAPV